MNQKKNTPAPDGNTPLLDIRNLIVHYETEDGIVEAVNDVSLQIEKGKVFGLIGETGAGKTTVALSILKLLPTPPANVIGGSIRLNGDEIYEKSEEELRRMRGKRVSMIFQDPMTALNPVMRIGEQISECIALHCEKSERANAELMAIDMLRVVGIPPERFRDYPHQFSGGMKQRVVIAMALACRPDLIIADEPTTALDVTIQAQVLALMKDLQESYGTAMLLITHDFGVVTEMCDNCAIMYAGEIVEMGSVEDIFDDPRHPYTIGLFESLPTLSKNNAQLKPVRGVMPDPMDLPTYCTFYDRCAYGTDKCCHEDPALCEVTPGHWVKCFRWDEQR